jgi:hypothetical protein
MRQELLGKIDLSRNRNVTSTKSIKGLLASVSNDGPVFVTLSLFRKRQARHPERGTG